MIELRDALVLGGYAFTWACYRALCNKIDNLIANHLAHLKKPEEKK